MASVVVNGSGSAHLQPIISQNMSAEENEIRNNIKASDSYLLPSHEELVPKYEVSGQEKITDPDTLDRGYLEYGCSHYRRRCRIRAPCCEDIFDCRHCHNEAKNSICIDHKERHDVPRHSIQKVICSLCGTEQECDLNYNPFVGRYYCGICKLFDDDTSKAQYHCDGCGTCRTGGLENFVHCDKCGEMLLCRSYAKQPSMLERAMHHDCPVCFEYLFESRNDVIAMICGHIIHKTCYMEMQEHLKFACPICSKSVCDMSRVWEKFDLEIAATPMPPHYDDMKVQILCNDCGCNSEVKYHIVAQKCPNCNSYNTRQTR